MPLRRAARLVPLALALLVGAPAAQALPAFPAATPSLVSDDPSNATPQVANGRVEALAQVGDRIIVGGTFTSVRAVDGTVVPRNRIFAYSLSTGQIDPDFTPDLDKAVYAIEPSSDHKSVLVGGAFKHVDGVARTYLVKIDTTTGATVSAFKGTTNGVVYDIARDAGRVFVTGWFTKSRGLARAGLMEINDGTGKVAPLALPLATTRLKQGVRRVEVTGDAERLVIAGNFTTVDGLPRDQVAVIDLTTSPASVRADWRTGWYDYPSESGDRSTFIRDIALSGDGSWFVVGTTWYCCPGNGDSIARFPTRGTGTDIQPDWSNFTGSDTVTALTVDPDGVVYAGGHFRWTDDRYPAWVRPARGNRYGLAALDGTTGRSYEWAPTRERGYGVLALLLTTAGDLVVGHDSPTVAGEPHRALASFPAAGGRTVRRQEARTLPVAVSAIAPGGAVDTRTFDGTAVTATAATPLLLAEVRAGAVVSGRLVAATASGLWAYVPDHAGRWVPGWQLDIADVDPTTITGLAFEHETLWLTIRGDARLHRRTISSDSLLIDPYDTVVSGPGVDGRSWSDVSGLFAAGGRLFAGHADGTLTRTPLDAATDLDVDATATVSGPAIDGQSWATGLFAGGAPTGVPAYRPNLAFGRPTATSSVLDGLDGSLAVDGAKGHHGNGTYVTSTTSGKHQWWEVDLGTRQLISAVVIWPRSDDDVWLINPVVMVSDTPITGTKVAKMTSETGVTRIQLHGLLAAGQEVPIGKKRRYVRIATAGMESTGVQLDEVEVLGAPAPVPALVAGDDAAYQQPAAQAGTYPGYGAATRATDGNTDGAWSHRSVSHTTITTDPWWQTDLGRVVHVGSVRISNRTDCCSTRLWPAKVFLSTAPFRSASPAVLEATPGVTTLTIAGDPGSSTFTLPADVDARYVRVQLPGSGRYLHLAEVEVLAG